MCQISLGAEIGHSTPEAVNFTNSGNIFTMYGPIMCAILNEIFRIYDAFTFVIWPVLLNSCRSCGPFTSTGVFPQNFQEPLCCRKKYTCCWATACKTVRPMLSDRCPVCLSCLSCPVCDVGVLWPNGWSWSDQDETCHAGGPRHRPHYVMQVCIDVGKYFICSVMSKLHWNTVQINCSPLYFYWQTIAWKFSDHG